MASRPYEAIFQFTRITVVTSGAPTTSIDAHSTTRFGRRHEVVAVTIGDLLVYCYDRSSVHTFATAWDVARNTLPVGLPDTINEPTRNRHEASVVLRVDGQPKHTVQGLAADVNQSQRPYVAVTVGPLTVMAFDRSSIQTWADIWADAFDIATRFWPDGALVDNPELRRRRRVRLTRPIV